MTSPSAPSTGRMKINVIDHIRTQSQAIEKSSVTSRIEILSWCNIHCLPSLEIVHVSRQFICNIFTSGPFLPLNRG